MKRLLAFVTAALLLASCRARTDVVVNRDGSGRYAITVEVPKNTLETDGAEGDLEIGEDLSHLGFPVTVDEYETSSVQGVRISFTFTNLRDLNRKARAFDDSEDDDPSMEDLANGIRHIGGLWVFEFQKSDTGDDEDELFGDFEEMFQVEVAVTLPGQAGRHDADAVRRNSDSTTFLWRVPAAGKVVMYAETTDALPRVPHELATTLIGIDAALLVLAYAASRRRATRAA